MPIFLKRTLVGFLSTLIVAAPAFAQDGNTSNPLPKVSQEWRFEVTPYAWMPGIKGTINFDNI